MNTNDKLVSILEEILPITQFRLSDLGFSAPGKEGLLSLEAFRNGYETTVSRRLLGHRDMLPSRFVHAEVGTDATPDYFCQLVEVIGRLLESYADPKTSEIVIQHPAGRNYLESVIPNPTVADFSKQLVRCAALFGVPDTVDLLLRLAAGAPMPYTEMTVLTSVRQDENRIDLLPGVRLIKLDLAEGHSGGIPEELLLREPNPTVLFPEAMRPADPVTTMLWVDQASGGPCIVKPGLVPHSDREADNSPTRTFANILSLVCDTPVGESKGWIIFDPKLSSLIGTGIRIVSYMRPHSFQTYTVTSEHSTDLRRLYKKSGESFPRELRIAMARWWRSKMPPRSIDRAIDIRIALESLFLGEGINAELSFRLALNGAWYLGANADQRVEYFETLKRAYEFSSRAVHTGRINKKGRGQVKMTIEAAQDICRRAIMKRLDEGKAPDWRKLVLGVGE